MDLPKYFFQEEFRKFEPLLREYGARPVTLKRGTYLLDIKDPSQGVYYISKGSIRYTLIDDMGKENHLMYFGPGQIFPFSLSNLPFTLDSALIAKIIDPGDGMVFTADVMDKLIANHPEFALQATSHLIGEVNILLTRELLRSHASPEYKVCNFLYLWNASHPTPDDNQVFTHTEMAAFVGLSRVQVSRVIGKLRTEGVIDTTRHRFRIKNMDELIRRCSDIAQENT